MRDQFEHEGFVVVEEALSLEQVLELRAAVDRVWQELRPSGGELHDLGFVGRDERFVELVDHPATLAIVRDTLGWNVFVYHCHLDVHPPLREPQPVWRWHQDGGRQNVDLAAPRPRLSVKVAYFLTDVESTADGPLWVIPQSHTRDSAPGRADRGLPPGTTPLLVRAGSAVVFDRRLWHARGDNVGGRTRKALFYAYTYRWIRARDDLVGVDDALLARIDPVRRQLLGGGSSTIGYWFPEEEDAPLRGLML